MDASMYERALGETRRIVGGIAKEDLDNSTPCDDWKVRDVLNHVINGAFAYGAGLDPEVPDQSIDHTQGDFSAALDEASERAVGVFRRPGAMDETFGMPWGDTPAEIALGLALGDAAVHGWDLARGTSQDIEIPDDIAQAVYDMTTGMMQPRGRFPREGAFADPVEIADDAPIQDKMLAYLGRDPGT